MAELLDLAGAQFGRLTVLGRTFDYVSPSGNRKPRWRCECHCGGTIVALSDNLRAGRTTSCGCFRRETTAANNANKLLATPSYQCMHGRICRDRGRAADNHCVDCGSPADEWSYDHRDPNELHQSLNVWHMGERMVAYSASVDHYVPRCAGCHRSFDITGKPRSFKSKEHA